MESSGSNHYARVPNRKPPANRNAVHSVATKAMTGLHWGSKVCGDARTGWGIFEKGGRSRNSALHLPNGWGLARMPLRTASRCQNTTPHRQTPCYPCKFPTLRITSPLYHLYTFALPTPYLGRFMFGFRLKAKPEHEAAQVGRR